MEEGSVAGCSTRAGHEPFPLSKIVQGWSSGESADCKGVSSGDDRAVTAEDRYDWMTLRMCVKVLEALLWKAAVCEKHSSDASSVEKVFVSVVDDNVQFRVSLMPKTFRLNFIGDLTFIKGANSFECGTIGNTKVYIDGSEQVLLKSDYLFPAWLIPATMASKSTLELQSQQVQVNIDAEDGFVTCEELKFTAH